MDEECRLYCRSGVERCICQGRRGEGVRKKAQIFLLCGEGEDVCGRTEVDEGATLFGGVKIIFTGVYVRTGTGRVE